MNDTLSYAFTALTYLGIFALLLHVAKRWDAIEGKIAARLDGKKKRRI